MNNDVAKAAMVQVWVKVNGNDVEAVEYGVPSADIKLDFSDCNSKSAIKKTAKKQMQKKGFKNPQIHVLEAVH